MACRSGARLCRAGLYGGQVRPRWPLHDPRRSPARDERYCAVGCDVQGDPRGGWQQGRSAVWHPWAIHHRGRDPAGTGDRALFTALVRRADPARCGAGNGQGRARRAHPHCHRRTADHQGRIRHAAAHRWGQDPATGAGARGRYLGDEEARRHGRGLQCRNGPASLCRTGGGNELRASIPNVLMCETIETPFHDQLIKGTIRVENGYITPPDAPGLGFDVDEELARAHPYSGDGPAPADAGSPLRLRPPLRR